MATIIALTNHKGGVAKTTSVSALAFKFAQKGNKVLMVDLDTQANLTYSYMSPADALKGRCLYDAIRERKNLPQVCIRENLYLVPNGLAMTLALQQMNFEKRRELILADLIRPVEDNYDIILIDCPPSLDILTLNAVVVADRVMVPMTTSQLSYLGVKMMEAWLLDQRDLNPQLCVNDIFFTQYDARERQTRNIETDVRNEFGDIVMNTVIHRNVSISESVGAYQSIYEYKPESVGARDYEALTLELVERIKNGIPCAAEDGSKEK